MQEVYIFLLLLFYHKVRSLVSEVYIQSFQPDSLIQKCISLHPSHA